MIKGDWDGLVELSNRSSGQAILRQAILRQAILRQAILREAQDEEDEGAVLRQAQDEGVGRDRLRMKSERLRMKSERLRMKG